MTLDQLFEKLLVGIQMGQAAPEVVFDVDGRFAHFVHVKGSVKEGKLIVVLTHSSKTIILDSPHD